MTETDSIVHKYLLTVSEKLAKQFSKKRPNPSPWAGPTLDIIIAFYKNNCKEETAATQNGTETQPVTNGTVKKKGKKRKLSELNESVTVTPAAEQAAEPEKKKKKKKKKKNKAPEVVEIIQDQSPAEDTPAAAEPVSVSEPEPAAVPVVPAETPTEETAEKEEANLDDEMEADDVTTPGGLVTVPSEDKPKKSKLQRKKSNASFRRVKEEDVVIKKKELADNTFEAKQGADEFGYKANQILKFTKGKSFRHEKTKKKRGTYKGGAINMGVTSIKFESDSD